MRYRVYVKVRQVKPLSAAYGEWIIVEAASENEAWDKARDELISRVEISSVLELP